MTDRRAFSQKLRLKILCRQNGLCTICGYAIRNGVFDIDHIAALCHEGTNDEDNLRAVHPSCHKAKTEHDVQALKKVTRLKVGGKQRRGRGFRGWRKFSGEIVWAGER